MTTRHKTTVIPATPADSRAIADLAEEMDRFYGSIEVDPLPIRVQQIKDALFANPPSAFALLAWNGNRLTGFAAYSFLWPAVGLTRSLFLKELYVAENARRSGVGRQLMAVLFALAAEQSCSRVEWHTETGNSEARAFYAALGGQELEGKILFRVEHAAMLQATDRGRPASS